MLFSSDYLFICWIFHIYPPKPCHLGVNISKRVFQNILGINSGGYNLKLICAKWHYHIALGPHVDFFQFCNQRSKLSSPISHITPIYLAAFHLEGKFNNWALKLKAGAGLTFSNMNNVIILKTRKCLQLRQQD